jgi:hypothetical protein
MLIPRSMQTRYSCATEGDAGFSRIAPVYDAKKGDKVLGQLREFLNPQTARCCEIQSNSMSCHVISRVSHLSINFIAAS